MAGPEETGAAELQEALSGVARAISESLVLEEIWGRVATACRVVVPFDGMGIGRFEPPDKVFVAVSYPATPDLQEHAFVQADFSPRLRPQDDLTGVLVVADARTELDASFRLDAAVLQLGYLSLLRVPLGHGDSPIGSLILVSRERGRFTEEHAHRLASVAELVTLALEHDRLFREEQARRRRLEALKPLVPALAEALDIRTIFDQVSRITQVVLPHDFVSLGLFTEDRTGMHVHATSETLGMPPLYRFTDSQQTSSFESEFFIAQDIEILADETMRYRVLLPGGGGPRDIVQKIASEWVEVFRKSAVRAQIRVPVRLRGRIAGGLTYHSRTPGTYGLQDVELVARISDHAALALAHKELAEESRRAAAAQERAQLLEGRVQSLLEELETRSPHRALGRSRAWRDTLAQATKVAPTDTTVLLTGDSGTGKEVVARFVHRGSARKDGPFVALNCAALPEQLLESELFGHEKGAFTGALATRPGKIEQASGGILFLDEVGEMSPAVQAKFLRVLQEREYQRLGGARTLKADVRVLAATNRDLRSAMAQGTFREDLYYRLAVFEIALPPLRDRAEDIPLLAEAFLEEIGRSVGRPAAGVSQEVQDKLVAYPWPGNVRELRNAIERAVILSEGGLVTSEHLPLGIVASARSAPAPLAPSVAATGTLDATERAMIQDALVRAGQNKSKAARLLGLTRAQLRSRLEKHGLA